MKIDKLNNPIATRTLRTKTSEEVMVVLGQPVFYWGGCHSGFTVKYE